MHLAETIWIVLGFALILAELFVNGFIIVFFGTSALVTGVVLWLGWLPTHSGIPLFFFIGLTLVQILTLRRYMKKIFFGEVAKEEVGMDEDFLGKSGTVVADFAAEPDADGTFHGKVEFRGTQWAAVATSPLAKGRRVTIERRDGSTIMVGPA
ncbi:MAG: hypothetical protein RL648_532 [Verrucomicrobiota bacterium]|jgi:membrane protein implicated in regulation of membrane protease activity